MICFFCYSQVSHSQLLPTCSYASKHTIQFFLFATGKMVGGRMGGPPTNKTNLAVYANDLYGLHGWLNFVLQHFLAEQVLLRRVTNLQAFGWIFYTEGGICECSRTPSNNCTAWVKLICFTFSCTVLRFVTRK